MSEDDYETLLQFAISVECEDDYREHALAALSRLIARAEGAERERDEARDVLSGLALFLGVGMGDETTTADKYDDRIRWGIDFITSAERQRCMDQCKPRDGESWTRGAIWTGDLIAARIKALGPAVTSDAEARADRLSALLRRMVETFDEAIDSYEESIEYKSAYLVKKHGDRETLAELRAASEAAKKEMGE